MANGPLVGVRILTSCRVAPWFSSPVCQLGAENFISMQASFYESGHGVTAIEQLEATLVHTSF